MTLLQQKRQSQEIPSFLDVMNRFGYMTEREIDENVTRSVPKNMENSKNSVWRQFMSFLRRKKYTFNQETPVSELAFILKNWAFNLKKQNGEEYKADTVRVKVVWNVTAKLLMYFNE
jgi:hypothetical protein